MEPRTSVADAGVQGRPDLAIPVRRPPSRLHAGLVLGVGQGVARISVALYSIILIHELSPAGYGDFAFAVAILGILITLADGGFSRLLIRDVAQSGKDRAFVISSLLTVRAGWVLALTIGVMASSKAGLPGVRGWVLAVLLVALALEGLAGGFESAGIGAERPARVATGQILGSVALSFCVLLIFVLPVTPALALAGLAVAALAKLACHVQAWRADLSIGTTHLRRADVRHWVRQAAPYLIMGALGTLYYRIDIVILHGRRGAVETASYAAAYRVVDAALVIGGVAAAAIAPHLSRIHRDDPGRVWSEWKRYTFRMALIATPFARVLGAIASPLSSLLFGTSYASSAGLDLRLLAPGIVFMLLQTIILSVLFTGQDTHLLLRFSFVLVAMNAALTWSLVGLAGSAGAATATSVSELVTFCSLVVFLRWRFRRDLS